MSENEKCSVSEMIGEFLRELAVLVLVFVVPLESYKGTHLKLWQLSGVIAITAVVALVVFGVGVVMERRRP